MGFNFDKLSVLVVEDTLPMRKLIGAVLDVLEVGEVIHAEDGHSGFAKFQKHMPDIVLLDWHMTPMSGIDLIREIRSNPLSKNRMAPIILITGYSALPRVTEARDAGATEYLVKPFSANDLARRIAYVINQPRDFVENMPDFFGPDRRRTRNPNYDGPLRRFEDLQARQYLKNPANNG